MAINGVPANLGPESDVWAKEVEAAIRDLSKAIDRLYSQLGVAR